MSEFRVCLTFGAEHPDHPGVSRYAACFGRMPRWSFDSPPPRRSRVRKPSMPPLAGAVLRGLDELGTSAEAKVRARWQSIRAGWGAVNGGQTPDADAAVLDGEERNAKRAAGRR